MKEWIFGEYFSAMNVLQTDHYNFHSNCFYFYLFRVFFILTEQNVHRNTHPTLFYVRYRTIEYWEPMLFINIYTFDCNFRSGSFFVRSFFFVDFGFPSWCGFLYFVFRSHFTWSNLRVHQCALRYLALCKKKIQYPFD